jgi:hypothetical protein
MPKFYYFVLPFITLDASSQKDSFAQSTESIIVDVNQRTSMDYNSNIATDFIMFEPDNGKPININKKTE